MLGQYKSALCLWSGGLDSTYMVNRYLAAGVCVDTVYLEIENNSQKVIREKEALEKLKNALIVYSSQNYLQKHYESKTLVSNFNFAFSQGVPLLLALMEHIRPHHDFAAVGYVMNDDAISYIPELIRVWNSFKPLVQYHVPLKFPLSKMKKEQIYNELIPELRQHVTWCELSENNEPCGQCGPCKRMNPIIT